MTLRLKGSYSVAAAENPVRGSTTRPITCNVIFLDDKSEHFKLSKNAPGQVLIDLVFDFLEVLERDFFGLQYNDFSCHTGPLLRWLESGKPLKKQLKGTATHTLWLRVKFYVPDPLWLQEEFTRYLVYLQVRKDVLSGTLLAPTHILAKMAGLCLQSELGDYTPKECKPGYVNQIRLVPQQTPDFEAEATEAHKSYRSYVPASAELEYLNMARRLELYGIHPQEVIDRKRTKLSIGVSAQGISVFRDLRRISLYTWDNVEKIGFSGKTFSVNLKHRPRPVSLSVPDPPLDSAGSKGKQELSPSFVFDSGKRAKVFWQFAVTCHTFFRVKEPPALTSGLNAPPISVTTGLSTSLSSPSGFSRFFLRGTRSRRSMSESSAAPGLQRTMSTLMEMRRRSKSFERGFLRGVSRRFSRRRSFVAPGRTQSVNLLNAYESRDSLGVISIPSFLEDNAKNLSTDLEGTPSPEKETTGPLSAVNGKSSLNGFSRRFRASTPSLARKHGQVQSQGWSIERDIGPGDVASVQVTPVKVTENGKTSERPSLMVEAISDSSLDQNAYKKRANAAQTPKTPTEETVLPRPTAFFTKNPADQFAEEAKFNSRGKLSKLASLKTDKDAASLRSLESNESTSELRQAHTSKSGSNRSIRSTDTSSISPNTADENLVMVGILPNSDGQYGFNVSGGADQKKPVIVSRVGENMPAGMCCPRLHVGDQIISINDHDISEFTQDQVVSCIRKSAKSHSRLLKLVVKSNVYLAENAVDDQYPETGDAPPRPPKAKSPAIPAVSPAPTPSLTELSLTPTHHGNGIHNHHRTTSRSPGIAPSTTTPTSSGLFSLPQTALKPTVTPQPPRVTPKPRITSVSGGGNAGTVRVKSSSSVGPRRALVSDTEALYHSIRAIENGLGDGSLVRTFEKLERGNPSATMRDAKESFNLSKNRYRDISPYDHSRVKIQGVDGDYINASFIEMRIPKSSLKRDYIASQGPLPNTCADFWQMCWEHGSELIVMLTSVLEQGRVKCHKYWPDLNHTSEFTWIHPKLQRSSTSNATNSSPKYIQLRVSNIKEEANADIAYREFQLQRIVNAVNPKDHGSSAKHRITGFSNEKGPSLMNDSEVRRVIQLQYISWPDHGVPSNCSDLINFVEKMREIRERSSSACAVVHCSAGIGRTGVVILLDTAMDMIRSHASVNPIEMVRQMREYREMLIQTPAQFRFVCETIVKYYNDTILKPSTIKKS